MPALPRLWCLVSAEVEADRITMHSMWGLRRDWRSMGGDPPAVSDSPLTAAQMAKTMLKRTPGWFYAHRQIMEKAGFPKPIPIVGKYHPGAVQAWIDRNGGMLPDTGHQSQSAPWKRAVV
jgi:hypothetical protein